MNNWIQFKSGWYHFLLLEGQEERENASGGKVFELFQFSLSEYKGCETLALNSGAYYKLQTQQINHNKLTPLFRTWMPLKFSHHK